MSYDWLKASPATEVDNSIEELGTGFSNLWLHQKICLLILIELHRFNLHLDMGGGKTNICLSLLKYRRKLSETPKAIVFVPYITAVETWVEETKKHASELKCVPLLGTTKENEQQLSQSTGDLFVMCYQSAVAMLAEVVPSKKKGKKKWIIDPKKVKKTFSGFDTLILDEVHKCKSIASLTYKMCRTISSSTEYSIGLTGTPFGKDLQDLWSQFYLIDFGETLGPTLGFYREVFFSQKLNYWGGLEYIFKKKLFPTLQKTIKRSSIRYKIEELHDMPEMSHVIKSLPASDAIKAYADEAIKKIKAIVGEKRKSSYRAVESEYLRLRQLSSGFMTFHGEDNDKVQIKFDDNPKLDLLEELVDALPLDCKMVVFHHFVYTNEIISLRLKGMKIGHARIWGGQRDPIGQLRKFKDDSDCRVLVINSKSGSSSLNLQHANYICFFEPTDSPIDRQQAERRVWRPGQGKRVLCYDLLMKQTADFKLHKANINGRNLLKMVLDGEETL